MHLPDEFSFFLSNGSLQKEGFPLGVHKEVMKDRCREQRCISSELAESRSHFKSMLRIIFSTTTGKFCEVRVREIAD
jgi:hypothetical protein